MSDRPEERDGPFDLKPSEMVEILERAGVGISRPQAAAFCGWAYSTFDSWRKDALLKAREEAFEEAAKIAEEYGGFVEDTGSPPSDFTNSGKNEAATDIASAIHQHSQKGEK